MEPFLVFLVGVRRAPEQFREAPRQSLPQLHDSRRLPRETRAFDVVDAEAAELGLRQDRDLGHVVVDLLLEREPGARFNSILKILTNLNLKRRHVLTPFS